MSRITIKQLAGPGERFAPHAFDGIIGQEVSTTFEGIPLRASTLTAAEVVEEGTAVWLTVEFPELPEGGHAIPWVDGEPSNSFTFRNHDDPHSGNLGR